MSEFHIQDVEKDEIDHIANQLIQFNDASITSLQEPSYLRINRCIKHNGEVIGGILTQAFWYVLQVDILWVKEEHRNKGYGAALLTDVENIAKEMGCKLSHLDTFDFQAKEFYEKLGYSVFGTLEDCPEGHERYYLSKKLVSHN